LNNENSIVLDCFCGSGTTLVAAQINNRKWIGIDQSELAIEKTKKKIEEIDSNLFMQNYDYDFITIQKERKYL
jgi:adenine-specific DNA-methyltransferase